MSKPMKKKTKAKAKVAKKVKKAVKKEVKKFSAPRFGQRVGNLFGKKAGLVGAEAGRLFRELTGFGDYKVRTNSIVTGVAYDSLPRFSPMKDGTRLRHREYLGDVITSGNPGEFDITTYPIQPGVRATFPWLSQLAENFDEYTIHGMVFEFKSNSYDALASTNTASGTVIMTTQYNVLNPPFLNKVGMEQYEFTCSDKPSKSFLHPVECARIETPTSVLTTRTATPSTGDLRLFDWGNFNIATVGMQGTSVNVGELWVTYDITLYKPKLSPEVNNFDNYVIDYKSAGVQDYPLGTLSTNYHRSTNSTSFTSIERLNDSFGNGNFIRFAPGFSGNVLLIYTWYWNQGPGSAGEQPAIAFGGGSTTGATPINILGNTNEFGGTNYNSLQGPTSQPMVYRVGDGYAIASMWFITGNNSAIALYGTGTDPVGNASAGVNFFAIQIPSNVDSANWTF